MQVIHIQSLVQSIFGILENHNVVKKVPVNLEIDISDPEAFQKLTAQLAEARKQIETQIDKEETDA